MAGGWDGRRLSSIELFPSFAACSIPDLPQPTSGHSLSLLSGGRLVVCGGRAGPNFLDSCISWVAGNTSWTLLYTMRCLPFPNPILITILVWQELITRPGQCPLFPTRLCYWAATAVKHSSLQSRCQVSKVSQVPGEKSLPGAR